MFCLTGLQDVATQGRWELLSSVKGDGRSYLCIARVGVGVDRKRCSRSQSWPHACIIRKIEEKGGKISRAK